MPTYTAIIYLEPPVVTDLFGRRISHYCTKRQVHVNAQHEGEIGGILQAAYPQMRFYQACGLVRPLLPLTQSARPTQSALFPMSGSNQQPILWEGEDEVRPARTEGIGLPIQPVHTSEPPSIAGAMAQHSHTAEVVTLPTIAEPEPPALFEADAILAESLPEPEPINPVGTAEYNIFTDRILARFNHRLSDEEAATIKGAKFQWWPGRRVWSAKWSVEAVDALAALGIPEGEIMDNDQPDNAEDRAEWYLSYGEKSEFRPPRK